MSGSTSLVPAGSPAVVEVADAEVVGEFLGGEVTEATSGGLVLILAGAVSYGTVTFRKN
jgi:hypothetical protein